MNSGASQSTQRSYTSHKRDYLKHLIEKKGVSNFSRFHSSQPSMLQVSRDVVIFPYTVDYLLELKQQGGASASLKMQDFLILKPTTHSEVKTEVIEKHVQSMI